MTAKFCNIKPGRRRARNCTSTAARGGCGKVRVRFCCSPREREKESEFYNTKGILFCVYDLDRDYGFVSGVG